jgi:DNA-binding transcriptional ArsR family regulator
MKMTEKNSKQNYDDEIFKSLSHKLRRQIILAVGKEKSLSFSMIQDRLTNIDSPSLAYHLKSMSQLLELKDNIYTLNEIGNAAYLLLEKIDQSDRVKKGKKQFNKAYIITVVCWILSQFIIPPLLFLTSGNIQYISIMITLNVLAIINYASIWKLKNRF